MRKRLTLDARRLTLPFKGAFMVRSSLEDHYARASDCARIAGRFKFDTKVYSVAIRNVLIVSTNVFVVLNVSSLCESSSDPNFVQRIE